MDIDLYNNISSALIYVPIGNRYKFADDNVHAICHLESRRAVRHGVKHGVDVAINCEAQECIVSINKVSSKMVESVTKR